MLEYRRNWSRRDDVNKDAEYNRVLSSGQQGWGWQEEHGKQDSRHGVGPAERLPGEGQGGPLHVKVGL